MKAGRLLIAAILALAYLCPAQETAPSNQPAAPEPVKPAMTESYVIEATDMISIYVWKEQDLATKGVFVRPDGMISVQLLGDIKASGKTPMQLAAEITERLKKYVQDPTVTVSLDQMNSKRVYLIGEVGHTGPLLMSPGMTLLQAIASSGGLTEFANKKKIYILRNVSGKVEKIPVQYKPALKGDGSLNLVLIPGDTIVVP
ncbi:MAG: polysaccharide biosynthesis/export family protein [Terracidiphilus sp.]|jgi:polysaccharide export outer membrane protein